MPKDTMPLPKILKLGKLNLIPANLNYLKELKTLKYQTWSMNDLLFHYRRKIIGSSQIRGYTTGMSSM